MRKIYIAKADTYLEIDEAEYPANSVDHVFNYGWTQILNDAAASIAAESENCAAVTMAKVQKKLDALKAGTVRVAGIRVGDPIKADAIELAIDMTVRGQFKKAGKALDAKAMRAAAIALVEKNPAYLHLAQKRADEAKAFQADLDLEDEMAALEPKVTAEEQDAVDKAAGLVD